MSFIEGESVYGQSKDSGNCLPLRVLHIGFIGTADGDALFQERALSIFRLCSTGTAGWCLDAGRNSLSWNASTEAGIQFVISTQRGATTPHWVRLPPRFYLGEQRYELPYPQGIRD
jgi:hypothetical protein